MMHLAQVKTEFVEFIHIRVNGNLHRSIKSFFVVPCVGDALGDGIRGGLPFLREIFVH